MIVKSLSLVENSSFTVPTYEKKDWKFLGPHGL